MSDLATEYQEQCKLVQWLRIRKIFHFAPTLENNTYKQNRKFAMIAEQKAKRSGKVKGTSDLFVFLPNKLIVIEMKRSKRKLKNGNLSTSHTNTSKEQLQFLKDVNFYDYVNSTVCYGYVEARELIEKALNEN